MAMLHESLKTGIINTYVVIGGLFFLVEDKMYF